MKALLVLLGVLFVSGCCTMCGLGEEDSATSLATTTLVFPEDTVTLPVTTTTTEPTTTTTLLIADTPPSFQEDDLFLLNVDTQEGGREAYTYTQEVKYEGLSDKGEQTLRVYYDGLRAGPGMNSAMLTSSERRYYSITNDEWLLNKIVFYQRSGGSQDSSMYEPGIVELKFPLSVGSKWSGSSLLNFRNGNRLAYKMTINYTAEVTGTRVLDTPKGKADCLIIQRREEEEVSKKIVQVNTITDYYCPALNYYGGWSSESKLPSGKKTEDFRIPEYRTVLELEEQTEDAMLA